MTNDLRILKRDLHRKMTIQEELLAKKFANKKLQQEHYAEMQDRNKAWERQENPFGM